MSSTAFHPKPVAELLRSVFDLTSHGMTQPLAETILKLDFPSEDVTRMDELSLKANEGTLTGDEGAELDAYIQVEDLLAYWKTNAREFLQHPG